MDQVKLFLEKIWADQRIVSGLTLALGLGLYLWYLGPSVPERYKNCPRRSVIFENPAFGYYTCLPNSWEGKFEPKSQDKKSFMVYTGAEEKPELFSIWAIPELRWEEFKTQNKLEELARGNGRVFAFKIGESTSTDFTYKSLLDEVTFVKQHFSVLEIETVEEAIGTYIENSLWTPKEAEGKVFSHTQILGSSLKDDGGFRYFTWTYAQEFIEKEGKLTEKGGELSVPIGYAIGRASDGGYLVQIHRVPRGGLEFVTDIQDIFPPEILPPTSDWFAADRKFLSERVAELKLSVRAKAREHFKITKREFEGYIRSLRDSKGELSLEIGTPSETTKEVRARYTVNPSAVIQVFPLQPILNQQYEILNTNSLKEHYQRNTKSWVGKKVRLITEGDQIVHLLEQ